MLVIIKFILIGFISRALVDYIGVPDEKQLIASIIIIVLFGVSDLDKVAL